MTTTSQKLLFHLEPLCFFDSKEQRKPLCRWRRRRQSSLLRLTSNLWTSTTEYKLLKSLITIWQVAESTCLRFTHRIWPILMVTSVYHLFKSRQSYSFQSCQPNKQEKDNDGNLHFLGFFQLKIWLLQIAKGGKSGGKTTTVVASRSKSKAKQKVMSLMKWVHKKLRFWRDADKSQMPGLHLKLADIFGP